MKTSKTDKLFVFCAPTEELVTAYKYFFAENFTRNEINKCA